MTAAKYHSSRPDAWVSPRWKDPATAHQRHGPLQPLETKRAPWWQRLAGRG